MNKYNVPKKEYENVKQEMNSFSGGGDSEDRAEYYNVEYSSELGVICGICSKLKVKKFINFYENAIVGGLGAIEAENITAVEFIPPINLNGTIYNSLEDTFIALGQDLGMENKIESILNRFTPITKEEFYDLNNI